MGAVKAGNKKEKRTESCRTKLFGLGFAFKRSFSIDVFAMNKTLFVHHVSSMITRFVFVGGTMSSFTVLSTMSTRSMTMDQVAFPFPEGFGAFFTIMIQLVTISSVRAKSIPS